MAGLAERLIRGLFDERPVFGMNARTGSNSHQSVQESTETGSKTYASRAMQVYHQLCDAIRGKGYEIIERSRSYLEGTYGKGTRGYEDGSIIEVEPGNMKALLHEYAAKLLKWKTGRTHDELHPQIYALAGRMERDLALA